MKNKHELSYRDLRITCNTNVFDFETTKDVEPIMAGIGQERGLKALEFGIKVDVQGYNLYVEGPIGVGRTRYTKSYLDKVAAKKEHLMIGVIFIILIIQMSQLQLICLQVKVKNLKKLWMASLKK